MASIVNAQILNTKLQSPQLPNDLIPRQKLIDYANKNITRPLTLVSAGGGFGKSTFVSSWLNKTPYKNAWFSIDENDNDLRVFLTYFTAAIQNEIPNFGQRINSIILTPSIPPINVIINGLINDLSELPDLFILALDDLHLINNKEIFQILAQLLKFPPKFFHLVLITRIDPPLPLTQLRSKNMMKDIRASHLRVTSNEIELFVTHWIKQKNIAGIVNLLEKKLDGWITGLRLAMLHISLHQDDDKKFEKFLEEANFSEDYFLEEVFEHLNNSSKEFLLKTSILEKFSSQLADYIIVPTNNNANSKKIINQIVKKNLFIINLDTENNWYRYHHLLLSLLRKEIKKRFSRNTIVELHKRAVKWYESHSLFDNAFYHVLQTEKDDLIANFIKTHMYQPLNMDKWYILEGWLKELPDEIIHKSTILLIAQMWISHHKNRIWVIYDLLKKIDLLKKKEKISKELEIQIQFFKAVILFWDIKIKESYRIFKYVKDHLHKDQIGFKGINAIYYATAAYMNGKGKEIIREFERLLSNNDMFFSYKHLLLGGIIYLTLLEGNFFMANDYILRLEKTALHFKDTFFLSWINYFRGLINYQQNNLKKAEYYFGKALKKIYILNMNAPIDCFAGMLLTLQASNKKEKFDKIYSQMIEFVNERNKPFIKAFSYSLRARLALINNDLQSAEKYMDMTDMSFDSGNILYGIEVPRLTYIKLLLAQNTPSKIDEAINKLDEISFLFNKTRNISQLIPTLVLQAVAYKKKGDKEKAIKFLFDALTNGKPNVWITPFVEAGEEIRNLLLEIKSNKSFVYYITQILGKLPVINKARISHAKLDDLTNREMDVIALLAKRYSNKEIANKLFISPSTVKRHTITIYQKLGVNSRRDAVIKARELGVLQKTTHN